MCDRMFLELLQCNADTSSKDKRRYEVMLCWIVLSQCGLCTAEVLRLCSVCAVRLSSAVTCGHADASDCALMLMVFFRIVLKQGLSLLSTRSMSAAQVK